MMGRGLDVGMGECWRRNTDTGEVDGWGYEEPSWDIDVSLGSPPSTFGHVDNYKLQKVITIENSYPTFLAISKLALAFLPVIHDRIRTRNGRVPTVTRSERIALAWLFNMAFRAAAAKSHFPPIDEPPFIS